MFILRVIEALKGHRVAYAIVGGYAVALHGAVRGTVDIDIIVKLSQKSLTAAERALTSIGLQSRIPVSASDVFEFRKEYIEKRNLVAWSFSNPNNPTEVVDIIITHDLSHMRTKTLTVNGVAVQILSLKDLIDMKRASGRPQDLEDVKALEKL
jgi:hypothetical protein